MIPIYEPDIREYKKSMVESIDSGWISNYGKFIGMSSDKMVELFGNKYCILMNNGTSATRCVVKALKFKHPEIDTIYVPNNVFAAVWNCVVEEYDPASINIEVMEINEKTLNIRTDESYLKSLKKNSAIFVVHNLGSIVNVPLIKRSRPDIVMIEDNCEGFLGKYEGVYTGTASLCSSVSFYANKNITTGEGGAFFTNDSDVFNYIKTYCNHGMSSVRYVHDQIGTNFRMTNVQAALLYEQLMHIDNIIAAKKSIFDRYTMILDKGIREGKVALLSTDDNTEKSNWIFTIKINDAFSYENAENFFLQNQIQIRPVFYDFRKHGIYPHFKCDYDPVISNAIMLPSSPLITLEQQTRVIDVLYQYISSLSAM